MSRVTESLSAATSIPFPEFTAAMMEGVFDTVIEMNIRQTEEYLNLVKDVSKSLTTYINETKDNVEPMEILDLLDSLPKLEFNAGNEAEPVPVDLPGLLGSELEKGEGTPPETPPEELSAAPPSALNALNKQLDIPGIVNAGAGAIVDITGAISAAAKENKDDEAWLESIGAVMDGDRLIAYDPVKFDSLETPLSPGNLAEISMAKIYDAIATNISANKYSLLQEMVKLGIVRVVVDNGLLETAMTFESITTEVAETTRELKNTNKTKTKYKRVQKLGRFARRTKGKDKRKSKARTKTVNVSTYKERHLNSQTEKGTLMGRSVIHWHTDYVPVREA